MPRKQQNATDFIAALVPLLTDLFPLIMEKWSQLNDRPRIDDIKNDLETVQAKQKLLKGKIKWLVTTIIVLILWNAAITIWVITRLV